MVKIIIDFLERYGRIITAASFGIAVLGIVFSVVRPNISLQTMDVNVSDNLEDAVLLEEGTVVSFEAETGDRPLGGIQIGITKYKKEITQGRIICEVYTRDQTETLLGAVSAGLEEINDGQYWYFPFEQEYEGSLLVKFYAADLQAGNEPGIITNGDKIINGDGAEEMRSFVGAEQMDGNIKVFFIYRVKTYPLIFDLCLMAAIFFTAFFAAGRSAGKHKKAGAKV